MKCFGSTSTTKSVIEGLPGNPTDALGGNGVVTITRRNDMAAKDVERVVGDQGSLPDTLHT